MKPLSDRTVAQALQRRFREGGVFRFFAFVVGEHEVHVSALGFDQDGRQFETRGKRPTFESAFVALLGELEVRSVMETPVQTPATPPARFPKRDELREAEHAAFALAIATKDGVVSTPSFVAALKARGERSGDKTARRTLHKLVEQGLLQRALNRGYVLAGKGQP